jgi:AcrR family transcriptional regulator
MPKTSDQNTKDRLLEATVEEIAERGWNGARTRSIAERAGVNGALVHYHFGSMENLMLEAVASTFAAMTQMAAESITAETIALGLDGMMEAISQVDPSDPHWQVLMEALVHSSRVPRLGELTVGILDQYRTAMIARLDAAIAAGELPNGTDTEGLALGLMALLDGLGLYAFVNPQFDTARAGRALVSLITKGTTS